ncbi:hypothetical protein [Phytoactinopolyspora mesophila]
MWSERVGSHIHVPTSHVTRKYRNLVGHPFASVMVDISRAGRDLRGVLIRGSVDLVGGDEARTLDPSTLRDGRRAASAGGGRLPVRGAAGGSAQLRYWVASGQRNGSIVACSTALR